MFSVNGEVISYIVDLSAHTINTGHNFDSLKTISGEAMGGFHDILSKVISSIRHFVAMTFGRCDFWVTMTFG